MPDPTFVTHAQVRAAYDALGLDPERFHVTQSFTVWPHEVFVVRFLRDEEGRVRLGHLGVPDTKAVTIPLGDDSEGATDD